MFLVIDEYKKSSYRPKADKVLIGELTAAERIEALVNDWPVIFSGKYQASTTLNGPAHILRIKVVR